MNRDDIREIGHEFNERKRVRLGASSFDGLGPGTRFTFLMTPTLQAGMIAASCETAKRKIDEAARVGGKAEPIEPQAATAKMVVSDAVTTRFVDAVRIKARRRGGGSKPSTRFIERCIKDALTRGIRDEDGVTRFVLTKMLEDKNGPQLTFCDTNEDGTVFLFRLDSGSHDKVSAAGVRKSVRRILKEAA